jgi:hypothetical protein
MAIGVGGTQWALRHAMELARRPCDVGAPLIRAYGVETVQTIRLVLTAGLPRVFAAAAR